MERVERLKEFVQNYSDGRVLLEAAEHAWFLVPAKELLAKIKGKTSFAVPADDGPHPNSASPLAIFVKRHRYQLHNLQTEFAMLSKTIP